MPNQSLPITTRRILFVGLSAIGFLATHSLSAQVTPNALELDPVEVLGLPLLEELEVQPTADKVARVSRDQIDALHATDLADALRTVPGLTISRFNPVGSFGGGDGGAIYIRGHGNGRPGSQISIMQDGVARFTAIWTHPLLDLLSVDNVHQAEVMKSPQPVLHGNMAFGAINLVAKSATSEGIVNRLKLGVGSWGTRETIFENSYGSGPLRSHFVASHRESDGHRSNSAGELSNLSYHFGYQFNETWSLSAFFNATAKPIPLALVRVRRRLDADFRVIPSLDELAHLAAMSRSHLCHQFRDHYNSSISEYVIRKRMATAQRLLFEVNLRPGEIAEAVGYPDIFQFSKQFKKTFGVSPSAYRHRQIRI